MELDAPTIAVVAAALVMLATAALYAVWPRPPEPEPDIRPLYPTVDAEVVVEALGRIGRETEVLGIRLQTSLANLGTTLGHELRRWSSGGKLTVHVSEREHPLAEALPKDRDDFRYLSDTTRRAAAPDSDPIQAARARILTLVDRPHIEMAQRVMALVVDRGLSFDRVYDLAAIGVPPHEWIRLLEVVHSWEHGEGVPDAVRMAPRFPPGEVSFPPSGRPRGDGDTQA